MRPRLIRVGLASHRNVTAPSIGRVHVLRNAPLGRLAGGIPVESLGSSVYHSMFAMNLDGNGLVCRPKIFWIACSTMCPTINIYTDGAAIGNPGPGGYGVVLQFKDRQRELSAGYRLTTNNRMELLAVIAGLEALKTNQYGVTIYSDSKYVVDSIEKKWVFGWVKKNFKDKKNRDLWLRYLALHEQFKPRLVWVKGHAGHPMNERCDKLAAKASRGSNLLRDVEYEGLKSGQGLFG